MTNEFKVLRYQNTADGQKSKVADLSKLSLEGWEVVSETIELSEADPVAASRDAACLCFLCGPFCTPFLMDSRKYKSKSMITVTLQRSLEKKAEMEAIKTQLEEKAKKEKEAFELEQSAEIGAILEKAKADLGTFYPNKKIIAAIERFLREDREVGGGVPSYAKTSVETSEICIRCDSGEVLARYPIESV